MSFTNKNSGKLTEGKDAWFPEVSMPGSGWKVVCQPLSLHSRPLPDNLVFVFVRWKL